MARRPLSPFNLAFLDIMFCGFGAVVLLVLVVNARMLSARRALHQDLRGEVERLEQEVGAARGVLVRLHDSSDSIDRQIAAARDQSTALRAAIRAQERENAALVRRIRAGRDEVRRQEEVLRALEADRDRTRAGVGAARESGRHLRRFEGQGHRQYLTGLKLGGRRVLILVDTSASMLDRTVVNVIRRRNMDAQARRNAPKWLRLKKTVAWIVANLPQDARLGIYRFGEHAESLAGESSNTWVRVTDQERVNAIMARLDAILPGGGTSLENGIRAVAALEPGPDNIILLTDGLPTMGRERPRARLVSGDRRQRLFRRAVQQLPPGVPVNIILFPMEGDPVAAALYWKLAVQTGGSFFTPTADWP
ncbi:VWA domain-containing protein [Thermodesulfobacteriota bacterium B35]